MSKFLVLTWKNKDYMCNVNRVGTYMKRCRLNSEENSQF